MSSLPPNAPTPEALDPLMPLPAARLRPALTWAALAVAGCSLAGSAWLWQRLDHLQEQLARQSADSGTQAVEARTLARQAQELARDTAARLSVNESRLAEVALQRSQLEDLMQSLSRSRDENLVVDIESSLRLAQQQAQLTGSIEPLLAALKTAEQRITRAAQPRLAPLHRALVRDLDRLKSANVTDIPGLLARMDDLTRQVDDLPVLNAVAPATAATSAGHATAPHPAGGKGQPEPAWWSTTLARAWDVTLNEVRSLVRVSRIDRPEAALLAPEQTFFLRENLKLKLLNARLAVLARQTDSAQADLNAAAAMLQKYFDPASRRTQAATALLRQVQGQLKAVELPRLDDTLTALATAAAGR